MAVPSSLSGRYEIAPLEAISALRIHPWLCEFSGRLQLTRQDGYRFGAASESSSVTGACA
jgi:hypothetical protein